MPKSIDWGSVHTHYFVRNIGTHNLCFFLIMDLKTENSVVVFKFRNNLNSNIIGSKCEARVGQVSVAVFDFK